MRPKPVDSLGLTKEWVGNKKPYVIHLGLDGEDDQDAMQRGPQIQELTRENAILFYAPTFSPTNMKWISDIEDSVIIYRYSRDALAIKTFYEDGFKLPEWATDWLQEHYLERLGE